MTSLYASLRREQVRVADWPTLPNSSQQAAGWAPQGTP